MEPKRKASEAYLAKLRDPRWQRRRLEIMERDGFTCQQCGDSTSTLNVHHRIYLRGRDPWEVADEHLVTLCEPCHERETFLRPDAEREFVEAIRVAGVPFNILVDLAEAIPTNRDKVGSLLTSMHLALLLEPDQIDIVLHETALLWRKLSGIKGAEPT